MNWPEALFYSVVACCVSVVAMYITERHYQSKAGR